MSIVQPGGILVLDSIADLFPPFKIINSVTNSYTKELNNANAKKSNSNILLDKGINMIGKKVKKGTSSIMGLAISQEGFFNFFMPLMTAGLPLMKNAITPLAKNVLFPLRLTVRMATTDEAIQDKNRGSGMTALIISNEEMTIS